MICTTVDPISFLTLFSMRSSNFRIEGIDTVAMPQIHAMYTAVDNTYKKCLITCLSFIINMLLFLA